MLKMPARQLRDPMTFIIEMKSYYGLFHNALLSLNYD